MHVLVVDDSRSVRGLFREALSRRGHDVDVASDAPEALGMAQADGYDVIFLDVLLGAGGNGFDVFDALEERGVKARIVLMTGRPMDARQQEYVERAGGVLSKPFDGLHRVFAAVEA
jgi:CheY-like chemotaxis protein